MGDAVVGEIAKAHGKTSAQVMLRFLVQQDVVVIPKSTNRERIFANAAVSLCNFLKGTNFTSTIFCRYLTFVWMRLK